MNLPQDHGRSARGVRHIASLVAGLLMSVQVPAQTLAEWRVTNGWGRSGMHDPHVLTTLWMEELLGGSTVTIMSVPVSSADIGKTFFAPRGPGFDAAAGLLTNGVNDILNIDELIDGSGAGIGGFESWLFFGDLAGASHIDLAGSTIGSIALHVNDLRFGYDSAAASTTIYSDYTIRIGAVPEPGSASLFGLGSALLLIGRQRWSARQRGRAGAARRA